MELERYLKIKEKIKNGCYVVVEWERTCSECLKGYKGAVKKHCKAIVRIGVSYANMERNKGKEMGSLPYGMFVYGNELIEKDNGDLMLRLTTSENPKHKTQSKYIYNGNVVDKQWLIDNGILGNRKPSTFSGGIFNINLKDIISIGGLQ